MEKRSLSFSSSTLKMIAMLSMLIDHTWIALISGNIWMNCLGRLAFPIFAFELVEGYFHTHDVKAYAKRLFLFALISEIPFDLIAGGTIFYPFHQNVMFTLLLGLVSISAIDQAQTEPLASQRMKYACYVTLSLLIALFGMVDYSIFGVFMILVFYFTRQKPLSTVWQFIAMAFINCYLLAGQAIQLGSFAFPIQGFALLALPLIWLYNGKQGIQSKAFRLFGYLFYPLHLGILAMLCFAGISIG